MTKRAKVIVVGAGPVGSTAAYRLAQNGIDVILLEAHPNCPEDLRASTFHPPSLEMLSEFGIVDDLREIGLEAPVYQYRNRQSGEVFSFDLSELSDMTDYPYRLQCEQYKLARLLTSKLADHPHAEVLFSRRLLTVEQDDKGVTVQVESPMEIETYKADFVIACDGANSTTRKWLGTGFEGFTYPEKFVTFSTKVPLEKHFDDLAYVNYVADPNEWMVLLRVPSVWRVLVPAHEGLDDFIVSDEKKSQVFQHLIGDPDVKTEHRTIYRVHQRVADSYFENRVILAGDSAHLNNPLGGFGMNSGIHDVWTLTDNLIPVLKDGGDHIEPLKQYERKRQGVMRAFVQAQTIKNKQTLESGDADAQKKHQENLTAILADDERRRDYLKGQAMFNSLELQASID
ncbi:FAD-dependent oxidoreductase [Ponticaulis profundi]|uniref:FAD-dependent oxidoreductase n=1 Tax=Ponticaulis profundi TaxID=2665222 RepID=A0ABW1S7P6_9PROT